MRKEIRIAGTGGMGVVLAGVILGHAAVVHSGLQAVQTQSYGSEARGTAAKSEVIISDEPIRYPKVREADYSVLMSQKAFDLYLSGARKGSVVMVDQDLCDYAEAEAEYEVVCVPAMKTADDMGMRLVSNMVMLGALAKKSELLTIEALEKAMGDMIKSSALQTDIEAVRKGATLV
ncbi:MAG: 2-oxoacid:acceptor oxidoreductase family protein [Candidatus Thorarchaeota archaeon]|jgi:2-oxoglutarate ferredoxin oxidoreductase subunit gamma